MTKKKQKIVFIDGHFYPVKKKGNIKVDNQVDNLKGIVVDQDNIKEVIAKAKKKLAKKTGRKNCENKEGKENDNPDNKPEDSKENKLFEIYKIWRSLPPVYKGMDKSKLKVFGFDDEDFISELLLIKTQTQFTEKFGVHINTLTNWNKKINDDGLGDYWKVWAKKLTANIMGAFGRRLISKGNGQDVLVWNKIVEDFREKADTTSRVTMTLKDILDELDK